MPRTTLDSLLKTGEVSEITRSLAGRQLLSHEEQLALAAALSLAGDDDKALSAAEHLAEHCPDQDIVADALAIAGRIDFSRGRHHRGAISFDRARNLATRTSNKLLRARVVAAHTEALLHFVSLQSAAPHFSEVRRTAYSAGSVVALFELHLLLAESEARLGRSHRADHELELASANGTHGDNPLRSVRLDTIGGLVAAYQGRYEDAQLRLARARRLALDCGALVLAEVGLNNLAYVQLLTGRFNEADATLQLLESSTRRSPQIALAAASTRLRLAMAIGDLAAATTIEESKSSLANALQDGANRYGVVFRLEGVPLLAASGRQTEAREQVLRIIERLTDTADRDLLGQAQLTGAKVLHQVDAPRAWRLLQQVSASRFGAHVETHAAVHLTAGTIGSPALAGIESFERAARAFGHIGHLLGYAQSKLDHLTLRASLAPAGSEASVVPHVTTLYEKPPASFGRIDVASDSTPTTMPDAVASGIRAAAAMVDLMSRPALSGYELLSLSASSGAAASGVLLSQKGDRSDVLGWIGTAAPDGGLRRASDDHVTIALGSDRGQDVSAIIAPRNQQSARVTLLALQRLVANGLALHQAAVAESEKSALWPEPLPEQQLGFVAASESMLELLSVTRRVAASAITVLITGETGTGKELLAHAIHKCSPRAKQRFLPFNCTAVPREMLDSQLFGYRRGAFTGASDAFPGVIRSAAGGTLFLDEIGEIGLDVQPKLLRFLESSDVHPLGEPAPVKVDVRVVAATNANLEAMMREGRFREDLYYRLNVVKLTIPPLRERREEIPLLLDHFLERCQKEGSKSGIRISDTAKEYLLLYDWPGNVRELANEMRRAVALAESGAVLMPEHLSPRLAASRRTVPAGQRPPTPAELLVRRDQPLNAAVEHVERALIMDALRVHGSVEEAARALGLSRKGLYLKRQRLKIDEV